MEVFPVSVPTGSLRWFCPSYHTVMGLAEQGAEGENDLGKPEAVEAQDNTLLRRAGQQCGNASGELPPQKVRDCCQPPVTVEKSWPLCYSCRALPIHPHAFLDSSTELRQGRGCCSRPHRK